MQTRCPNCHTLYRIDDDVLARAGGQASCFRCDTVFEAQPAEEQAEQLPEGDLAMQLDEDLDLGEEDLPDLDSRSADLGELSSLPEIPDADANDDDSDLGLSNLQDELAHPEPETDINEPLNLDLVATPSKEREPAVEPEFEPEPKPLNEPRIEIPEGLPELEPADEAAPTTVESLEAEPPAQAPSSRWPAAAAALLILLALGQLGWQQRQTILATPVGHALAEGLCSVAGCQVPARRAPSRYIVLERSISPAAGQAGVLSMHLSFRNTAEFAQPLPDIQLSLYDSEEKLIARRRLHPDEYLFPAPTGSVLVDSGELMQLTLNLEDPGRKATGFKLEFL